MIRTVARIAGNALRTAAGRDCACRALFPLYHITPFCNLGCSYCEGFPELGLPRERATNPGGADWSAHQLSTDQVKRLIGILRREFDFIFITGGEPLVRNDIEEVMEYAGSLRFRAICINTNSVLLPARERVLDHLSQVVVSLDTLRIADYAAILGCDTEAVRGIIANVERYKRLERERGYKLKVHAVIFPGKIGWAEEVLEFCLERDIAVCFSPLQIGYKAHGSFVGDGAYRGFIDRLIDLKTRRRKISGSFHYYRNIRDMIQFRCIPILIPRILPDGRMLYPCRPRGKIAASVLESGSWKAALRAAVADQGAPEPCNLSCRIRCYIEPSLLMRSPTSLIREFV